MSGAGLCHLFGTQQPDGKCGEKPNIQSMYSSEAKNCICGDGDDANLRYFDYSTVRLASGIRGVSLIRVLWARDTNSGTRE